MSYDAWKSTDMAEDYTTSRDADELLAVRSRLKDAVESLTRAKRSADLSHGRRSRISSTEAELHDIMADIDEELAHA